MPGSPQSQSPTAEEQALVALDAALKAVSVVDNITAEDAKTLWTKVSTLHAMLAALNISGSIQSLGRDATQLVARHVDADDHLAFALTSRAFRDALFICMPSPVLPARLRTTFLGVFVSYERLLWALLSGCPLTVSLARHAVAVDWEDEGGQTKAIRTLRERGCPWDGSVAAAAAAANRKDVIDYMIGAHLSCPIDEAIEEARRAGRHLVMPCTMLISRKAVAFAQRLEQQLALAGPGARIVDGPPNYYVTTDNVVA